MILLNLALTLIALCGMSGHTPSSSVKMCEGDGRCYSYNYFYPDDPDGIRHRECLPELPDGIRPRTNSAARR